MKNIFHIKKHKQILFLFVGISILFSSCIREDIISDDNYSRDGYMKIYLNTPDLRTPHHKQRAMGTHAERTIDQNLLSILVFKCSDDTETFYYQAPISGSIIYEDGNKAVVTVKLAKSASFNDLYRIMIVANHDISGINMIKDITTKTEILEQLTYSVSGKWNADSDNYSLFPMWGETIPIEISENTYSPTINLYRALARIDVGLNFGISDGKLTEQAYGIGNFQLKEIIVYRTYDKGFVAPINTNFTTAPSVPSSAIQHADNSPLNYLIENIGGANSYVREIYVPEADLPISPTNDNVHCIVVGGYYNNSSVVSYYRLDFATETNDTRTYLPILRNHRYAFNIIQVRGTGATSAQKALDTYETIDNIDYDLIVWDETIHEMEIQGKYYFGLDNRNLLFEAQSTINDTSNFFTIKYQTNYPLSVSDSLKLIWTSALNNPSSTPLFSAQWQASNKSIRITAETDNTTKNLLTDTLLVYAGPFMMKVAVQQKYIETTIIPRMHILVLSYIQSNFGYTISRTRGGAGKIFNSPNNFGPYDNSIVKTEGFYFIESEDYLFNTDTTSVPYKWITGIGNEGKIADIIYLANYAVFNSATGQLLTDYLDKGGVIVVFNQDVTLLHLINSVLGISNTFTYPYGPSGSVYPFPANPYFISEGGNLQDILSQFENDPILNGPFGDVRDKQWGEDASVTMNLGNIPITDTNLTIYSYLMNISPNTPVGSMNYVNSFKYETENRNMIWFGDGGFMASGEDGQPYVSATICPLYWNLQTSFPEAKPIYGNSNPYPVYNSIVFCNTMAWAVNKSESLRAKRKSFEEVD